MVGGNEWFWGKLSFNFGVRSGMLSTFCGHSRAALARINYKLIPNYSHNERRHVVVAVPGNF